MAKSGIWISLPNRIQDHSAGIEPWVREDGWSVTHCKEFPQKHTWTCRPRYVHDSGVCILMVTFSMLGMGMDNFRLTSKSIAHLFSLGFGQISPETVIGSMNFPGSGVAFAAIIANLPQIGLSLLYFTYNGIFSCMLLTQEWFWYAMKRQGLRLSSPQGIQRGSYRLQLPYRYGVPLLIGSGLLHWLLSVSIFLARITVFDSVGNEIPGESISTCAYSPMPIIFFGITGSIAILFGIGTGCRNYAVAVPLAGSCSAVISAACHPPEGRIDTTLKPVMWGKIDSSETDCGEIGDIHYSFT